MTSIKGHSRIQEYINGNDLENHYLSKMFRQIALVAAFIGLAIAIPVDNGVEGFFFFLSGLFDFLDFA